MLTSKPNHGLEADLQQIHKLIVSDGEGDYFEVPNQSIVRDSLKTFLPHVKEQAGTVLFEHIISGRERSSSSKPASGRSIPVTQIDKFEKDYREFAEKAKSSQTVPKAKQVINNFRLPDPDLYSDFYRTYGSPWNKKLLILWGCERQRGTSIPPLDAIAKLRRFAKPFWLILLERAFWLCLLLLPLCLLFLFPGMHGCKNSTPPNVDVVATAFGKTNSEPTKTNISGALGSNEIAKTEPLDSNSKNLNTEGLDPEKEKAIAKDGSDDKTSPANRLSPDDRNSSRKEPAQNRSPSSPTASANNPSEDGGRDSSTPPVLSDNTPPRGGNGNSSSVGDDQKPQSPEADRVQNLSAGGTEPAPSDPGNLIKNERPTAPEPNAEPEHEDPPRNPAAGVERPSALAREQSDPAKNANGTAPERNADEKGAERLKNFEDVMKWPKPSIKIQKVSKRIVDNSTIEVELEIVLSNTGKLYRSSWEVDGKVVSDSQSNALHLRLSPGEHKVAVSANAGGKILKDQCLVQVDLQQRVEGDAQLIPIAPVK